MFYDLMETPVGTLAVVASEAGLRNIIHCNSRPESVFSMKRRAEFAPKKISDIAASISAYLKGEILHFDIPLDVTSGTELQQRVWETLLEVPYGERISYTTLAGRVERPRAVRAVASACGANPIPLVVPCHRIVAKDGSLGGFAWGLENKEWLLAHEQQIQRDQLLAA